MTPLFQRAVEKAAREMLHAMDLDPDRRVERNGSTISMVDMYRDVAQAALLAGLKEIREGDELIRHVAWGLADVPPNHPAWPDDDLKRARYWDAAERAVAALSRTLTPSGGVT